MDPSDKMSLAHTLTHFRAAVRLAVLSAVTAVAILQAGCQSLTPRGHAVPVMNESAVHGPMPRELSKVTMPEYIIEPPDILLIDALNVVPRAPYHLRTTDVLSIQVDGTLPEAPIQGAYAVEPGGVVNLGMPYGSVSVTGVTVDEAKARIERQVLQILREPVVTVSLLQMSGQQQIAGQHLVTMDGVVNLGVYGKVPVVGMTTEQAKRAIETHLSMYLDEPEVSVDIFAYNSKTFYIITEGAGAGDQVTRLPVTGNETVLDAISQVGGLSGLSSKRIWIARPTPYAQEVQVMPVDWVAITAQGSTVTNYQILPGDRIFIAENEWVATDTRMAKLLAPVERAAGFSLLMVGTLSRLSGNVLAGGGTGTGFFGGF
jgi:polysaccharide export outer membrane protein